MRVTEDEFRRLVADDYDLIAREGAQFPTARLYDRVIAESLPDSCRLVVDVGCGCGQLTRKLAERADSVLAIDISPEMIRRARSANAANNARFAIAAVEDLWRLVPSRSCSAIVANRVLHHCANLSAVIAQLRDLLEPGGRVIILDLDSTSLKCSYARRMLLSVLYRLTVMTKAVLRGTLASALRDLRAEGRAYSSPGWRRHLSHEPVFSWRDVRDALGFAGLSFTRQRINWRFHLFVASNDHRGSLCSSGC